MATDKKYGSGGRKQFVRTRVPLAESVSGAVILLLLAAIAVAIYHKGRVFDPNLYAVRADSLKSTAAAVVGKAGTAPAAPATAPVSEPAAAAPADSPPAAGEGSAEGAGEAAAAPKAALKGEPLEISLPGCKPMSDTEFYNSDNLFEKIDGRAPAYQNYNVQQLRCRSFAVTAAAGSYVDVYEYHFDNPVDAFGMFSLERDPKGEALDFAADGYSGAMGYFFRRGAVYVQIIASDEKAPTLVLAKAIAQDRARAIPENDSGLAGRRKLPADGLIADSVSFVPENAQGQAALKNVFQARYKFAGAELPFFVMVSTPDDAAGAWKSFQDFCVRFGKAEPLPDLDGGKLFRAQLFGKWKVVYQRAGEVGGTFDAADAGQAQAFVEKYLRGELK
ncbi:MAG: DUF6599 family protein [Verrucomicrobiota bacterium]|jgi:hypothetical protein